MMGLPSADDLRTWADNPAAGGMAPVHPVTLLSLADELDRLHIAHQRYETARRMNPRQWTDAWKLNTTTGKPFDEIIDDLRPFMVPNLNSTASNDA